MKLPDVAEDELRQAVRYLVTRMAALEAEVASLTRQRDEEKRRFWELAHNTAGQLREAEAEIERLRARRPASRRRAVRAYPKRPASA
jgi:peptidoglycan hydrolase CwlO-like protein